MQEQCVASAGTGPTDGMIAPGTAEPRKPALSPSRALDFKQCPLLYRFRAIDRLPELPRPAQVRGTLVHAVLERLFDLPAAERTPEAARALVEQEWKRLTSEPGDGPTDNLANDVTGDPTNGPEHAAAGELAPPGLAGLLFAAAEEQAAWLASAAALLDVYFTLEDPRTIEPAARELLVETETAAGVPLRGYLDRLDVTPTGGLRIIDYKTGVAPGETGEARALFQMKFYALALLRIRGVLPAQLRLYYLGDGQELSYSPEPDELARFGLVLDAIWSAIQRAASRGDFPANPGPGCEWCDHRARCPAWEGTPPPYPGRPGCREPMPVPPPVSSGNPGESQASEITKPIDPDARNKV